MRRITVCRFYVLDTRWSVALKDSFEDEVYRAWRDGDQRAGTRTGGILKTIHDIRDASGVRLLRQIAKTHSITRVFEGHHVVRIQGNGPWVFPRRKQILRQVGARHVIVMRSFDEQIQDVLILPAITHQIVQH